MRGEGSKEEKNEGKKDRKGIKKDIDDGESEGVRRKEKKREME